MIDKQKVIALVREALDVDIDEKSSSETVEQWDSLGRLSIVSALDKQTEGKAGAISALINASSIQQICEILDDHNLAW